MVADERKRCDRMVADERKRCGRMVADERMNEGTSVELFGMQHLLVEKEVQWAGPMYVCICSSSMKNNRPTFSMHIAKAQVNTGILAVITWFMLSDKYTKLELLNATFIAVKTPVAT
eukprot:1195984-Prorocentrum_minimum.AAC.2